LIFSLQFFLKKIRKGDFDNLEINKGVPLHIFLEGSKRQNSRYKKKVYKI